MIEEENEKVYRFFTIILLFIQGFIIGIFCIFFVSVCKVKAADYQTLNPTLIETQFIDPNGTTDEIETCAYDNIGACNLNLTTNENQRFSMKFSASYYGSASNSISVNYVVGYKGLGNQGLDTVFPTNSVIVRYLNAQNGVVKDVSNNCSTNARKVSGRGDTPTGVPSYHTYFIVTTTCNIINPEGNANKLQIYVTSQTNNTLQSSTYARIGSYTLNRISGTINDTDRILANNIQNTQWIINNIESGTSSIVNGIDAAKEGIINNQNENTDKIIDSMKDCIVYDLKNEVLNKPGVFGTNGNIVDLDLWYYVSKYIKINKNSEYHLILNYDQNNKNYCLYDENKNLISCNLYGTNVRDITINSGNASYIRYVGKITGNNVTNFKGKYCANGNEIVNDSVNDLKDSITDPNVDINNLPTVQINTGPISAILSMPVELAISVLNGIDGTCEPYTIGRLFNHTLTLPCVNIPSIIGQNLWTTIDIIISGIFAFSFRRKLIDLWNALIHLRTAKIGSDEL